MAVRTLEIAIAGYGSAGQAAAILLARDGHRVTVFERAATPMPVGAGLLLQPTGLAVLDEMGLLSEALMFGAPVRRLLGDTPDGRQVLDMRYTDLDRRLFGLGMQRAALFDLLHAARPDEAIVKFGAEIDRIDSDDGRLITVEGVRHGPFDLILIADGAASRLRQVLAPHRLNQPYPWGALWCLVALDDWPQHDVLRQRYRSSSRMIGLLPVGIRRDDPVPRLSFFWSLPAGDFQSWRARGLPAWRRELDELWPEAATVFAGLPGEPDGFAQASYRDTVLGDWHRGRVCAIGDAAHAMSPQLGQGVNMALLDALAMREALRAETTVAAALAHFVRIRRRHIGVYHFWSRWLTPLFQSDRHWLARLRDALFPRLGRWPGSRSLSLALLTGRQQGLIARRPLSTQVLLALSEHQRRNGHHRPAGQCLIPDIAESDP